MRFEDHCTESFILLGDSFDLVHRWLDEFAARQHIISDLRMEGWKEDDGIPKDERDYVRMGLF